MRPVFSLVRRSDPETACQGLDHKHKKTEEKVNLTDNLTEAETKKEFLFRQKKKLVVVYDGDLAIFRLHAKN